MFQRSIVCAALLVTCLSTYGIAGTESGKGNWEFTLSGSGNSSKDFDAGNFGVNVSLGYFFTDMFELSGRQTINYGDSGSDTSWSASSRIAADLHFPLGDRKQFVPFVGANIGYVYGDGVADTGEAAPEAGLKWFANDTTFLFVMAEYQFFFNSDSTLGNAFDDGQFVYTVGMGLRF